MYNTWSYHLIIILYSDDSGDQIKYGWVDTIGWDDKSLDDECTFQSLLQYLDRNNLTRIKAILWTVHPGAIRQNATFYKQAKLIDSFAEKKIWDNVIIICN